MSSSALSLTQMTAVHMQARNMVLQRGGQLTLPSFPDWLLSFEGFFDSAPRLHEEIWLVEGAWAGALFYAYVPTGLFTQWLQNWIPNNTIELPELPEQLLAAVVDGFATQMIDLLSRLNKGRLRLNSVRRVSMNAVAPSPYWVHFLFQHTKKQEHFPLFLGMDDLGLIVLAQQLKSRPLIPNGISYHFVSLKAFFTIGTTTIAARRLKKAKVHDVLLFDRIWLDHKGLLFVSIGQGIGFWVVWKEHQIIVHSVLTSGMGEAFQAQRKGQASMSDKKSQAEEVDDEEEEWDDDLDDDLEEDEDDEPNMPSVSTQPVSLDHVDVHLLFDIGEKNMSFQELGELRKGQVFDLGRPLKRAVSIRANGTLIGEGELVEVDGHLGVMIHHLVSERSS